MSWTPKVLCFSAFESLLCLNDMSEAFIKVVKDLFAWRDSHF